MVLLFARKADGLRNAIHPEFFFRLSVVFLKPIDQVIKYNILNLYYLFAGLDCSLCILVLYVLKNFRRIELMVTTINILHHCSAALSYSILRTPKFEFIDLRLARILEALRQGFNKAFDFGNHLRRFQQSKIQRFFCRHMRDHLPKELKQRADPQVGCGLDY